MDSFSQPKTSWARRVVFISSIVVHVGAAIGLIIYSVFHVEELPPPEVTLTFFNAPPPPPPPPPPAGGSQQKKSSSSKPKIVPTKKPTLVEPTTPKPKDEPKQDTSADDNKGGGEPGGVPGGVAGGVPGGVVGGVVGGAPTAAPPPPPPAAAAPKFVPSFVFDKERIASPDPHLSDEFKDHHKKSSVTGRYRMCIGTDGHLTEVSVQAPLGGTEDDQIIRQLRGTWLWKPQPLPLCTVRVFTFNIN